VFLNLQAILIKKVWTKGVLVKVFIIRADESSMKNEDRRKYPRVQICDPITYLCQDSRGNILEQNVGIARNVSQNGIQIETYHMIQSEYALLMFLDLEQNHMEIEGKITYCRKIDTSKYKVGISLQGSEDENIEFVKALVRYYHYQKEKSHLQISPTIPN
jgi:hypothetical protein